MNKSRPFVTKVLKGMLIFTMKTFISLLHHLEAKPMVKIIQKMTMETGIVFYKKKGSHLKSKDGKERRLSKLSLRISRASPLSKL